MICPNRIKHCFSQATRSYNEVALLQQRSAEILVDLLFRTLPAFYPQTILDLGTGTGYIPELLWPYFPKSHYTLNDISETMITNVKKQYKHQLQFNFSCEDMVTANFNRHDLIISNLAFQWLDPLHPFIQKQFLNSQCLAFSGLLSGTFSEWGTVFKEQGLKSPLRSYPRETDLKAKLRRLNPKKFHFETRKFQLEFQSILSFMQYLKQLGAQSSPEIFTLAQLRTLIELPQKPLSISYHIFYAILERA